MASAGAATSPLPKPIRSAALITGLFLLLATSTQLLLALYGLLARYAQVVALPPVPALRLVVLTNLIGEAFMVAFHLAPKLLLAAARRLRQRPQAAQQQRERELGMQRGRLPVAVRQLASAADAEAASSSSPKAATECAGRSSSEEACGSSAGGAAAAPEAPTAGQQEQQQQQRAQPPLRASRTTVRAPVPLVRGMTRRFDAWRTERPLLRRNLALGAITLSFCGCCSLQILAPGFVDVSIVMLTTQWTTLCIALTQALLLRHRLPRAFWPCAALMLGGACLVIVPSVGQSATGGLHTVRGWMGFLMAIGALISTVIYYVLLQGTRHFGFTPLLLQHLMNTFSILLFTCLSLPIDGASWSGQFVGWTAEDWVALVALSSACYLGSGMLMQVCVRKLGAPTASMFFGLRLVFAVVLSTPILGSTIIETGLQIAGVVVTACAVTAYAASQWWASRATKEAAATEEEADEEAGTEEESASEGRVPG